MNQLALNPRPTELSYISPWENWNFHSVKNSRSLQEVEDLYHRFRLMHARRINDRWAELEGVEINRQTMTPDQYRLVRVAMFLNTLLIITAKVLQRKIDDVLPAKVVQDQIIELEINGRIYAYRGCIYLNQWQRYAWPADDIQRVFIS